MRQILRTQLTAAVVALKKGGVVLFPSESSYGLFTPVRSQAGVRKILKLKHRRDGKCTVVASSVAQVLDFFPAPWRSATVSQSEWLRIAWYVWPGPVSLVVSPRLSVRVPDMPLLRQLARRVGQPLIATSANLAGQPPAFSVIEVGRQLDLEQLDAVVDVGPLPKRLPSAVVQVIAGGVNILRSGPKRAQKLLSKLTSNLKYE